MRYVLCASIIATVVGGTAGPAQTVKPKAKLEVGRFYIPNAGKRGTVQLRPGDQVLRQPVLWGSAATLPVTVSFPTSTGPASLPAGTILPALLIGGLPGRQRDVTAYCTALGRVRKRGYVGMFGALGNKLLESQRDGRKCLLDADGDGLAEQAFLIADGAAEDRRPHAIKPVPLGVAENVPAGPGDYLTITLRREGRPALQGDIYQSGKRVAFDSFSSDEGTERRIQALDTAAAYPIAKQVFGAAFTIDRIDPATGVLTISWPDDRDARRFPVPSEVSYRYQYVLY